MASRPDSPAQLRVQRLDRVRCVDDPSDAFGIRQRGLVDGAAHRLYGFHLLLQASILNSRLLILWT